MGQVRKVGGEHFPKNLCILKIWLQGLGTKSLCDLIFPKMQFFAFK